MSITLFCETNKNLGAFIAPRLLKLFFLVDKKCSLLQSDPDDFLMFGMKAWDYRVIGINIQNQPQPNSAQAAKRLDQSLSKEFLEQQFPEQYKQKRSTNVALQCQKLIQIYGRFGWKHYQQGQMANMAILYFRRRAGLEVTCGELTKEEAALISSLDPLQLPY